jgi:hypothetical protein
MSSAPASASATANGQPDHVVVRHLALQRAAERRGDTRFDLRLRSDGVAQGQHFAHLGDHGKRRLAHVRERMRFTGGDRHRELVGAGAQCRFGALAIRHQRHHRPARMRECMADHFRRVGHLRQQPGGDKRSDFDLAQAGGMQGVDPAQLVCGGHRRRDRLQAVARTDLADEDLGLHGRIVPHRSHRTGPAMLRP